MKARLLYIVRRILHFIGNGALARGKGKGVHAGKPRLFYYREAIAKIFVGLSRETCDNVGSNRRVGEKIIYQRAFFKVLGARVAAVHPF